ncbi:hypothetical protein ACFU44_06000 [Nocardia rhizosphaerihabitans]|uniref:hypothetical protein n=1 Tax=Nocardia rhizosphaerihabitans TaxID=1691570 RepID=UPI003671B1AA
MNPSLTSPWVLLAAVVIAAIAVGCSTNQARPVVEPACRATAFPPPHDGVHPCSAPEVLHAAVSSLYGLDPLAGRDASATLAAARPLLQPAFAAEARGGMHGCAPISAMRWQDWIDEKVAVSTEVRVRADDHPPDTATSSSRVLSVTITPTGQAPIVFAVYARAVRQSTENAWLLADLRALS